MDAVYVLGTGSKMNDFELRMSIRSLHKNMVGIDNIWLIGEKPEWYIGNHVPYPDNSPIPDKNIMDKLLHACQIAEISEDFLFVNDDHYIIHPAGAVDYPYYYSLPIHEVIQSYRNKGSYFWRINNTMKALKDKGLPGMYYDIHYPIRYNKRAFVEAMKAFKWDSVGYIIKSLYCNYCRVDGERQQDFKMQKFDRLRASRAPVLSSYDVMCYEYKCFLYDQFDHKSPQEL